MSDKSFFAFSTTVFVPVSTCGCRARYRAFISLTSVVSLCFSIIAFLPGCAAQPQEFREQFLALGTLVEVTIHDTDESRAREAADDVRKMLEAFTERWRPHGDGELGRINAALAKGETVAVSDEAQRLIREAAALSRASDSLFNPAIGALVHLWQFDVEERADVPPPAADAVAALVHARPGMAALQFDNGVLGSDNPAVRLDLGAYAKGVAVDRAIALLHEHGITDAIVNAGGDLRAIGRYRDEAGTRAWRIGIRHPRGPGFLASLEVSGDESVFTSGDYERHFDYDGRRYHHILDPRTGYPAAGVTSVTVIHDNGAEADAAATALFVAGVAEWPRLAEQLGISYVMLVDGQGNIHLSPAMAQRISFETAPPDIETGETGAVTP